MLFLKLRGRRKSADDSTPKPGAVTPLIVDKPNRWSKRQTERALQRTRCQLISGGADSGKSRWLARLHSNASGIWGSKSKLPPIYLCAMSPLSSWIDQPHVEKWHDETEKTNAYENDRRPRFWHNLNQQQKADRLSEYLRLTGSILMIDDAHRLTGRKQKIALRCLSSARIWLLTTNHENRLPPAMRTSVERRSPQRTHLATDASYDATGFVVWMLIVAAIGAGWWEAALIFGGLKMAGSGRRASRAE